jgi:hypothetical protein
MKKDVDEQEDDIDEIQLVVGLEVGTKFDRAEPKKLKKLR